MKEVQIDRLVKVTEIIKLTDEEAEIYEVQVKTVEDQRAWAKNAKDTLGVDDLSCDKVKITIRDIPEEKKATKAKTKKETKPKKSRKKELTE